MKHKIKKECLKNLAKLSEYLLAPRLKRNTKFDMSDYVGSLGDRIEIGYEEMENCGSVGCAVGHGPYAGIPKAKAECWDSYSSRCFSGEDNDVFQFLFGSDWAEADNTRKGAAKRIQYFLETGEVPSAFNRGGFMEAKKVVDKYFREKV
jgi:hypothetical protein